MNADGAADEGYPEMLHRRVPRASGLGPYELPLRYQVGCMAGCLLAPFLPYFGLIVLLWLVFALVSGTP